MTKLILLFTLAFGFTVHAESYSDTFTSITGIEPGAYRLAKGPKSCIDGDLEFVDKVSKADKRTPGIAFVLNSHPLASFLGGRDEGGERALKWTSDSTVSQSRVEYHKVGTLDGRPVKWDLTILPQKDGFIYTTELKGQVVTCELAR